MAVFTINEIHEGRDGELEFEGERTRTRVFRTVTTSNLDDATIVEAGLASSVYFVTLGAAHNSDAACFCQRIRSENVSFSKKVWITTCSYSNRQIDNPLDDPAEIDWDTQAHSKILIKDRSGNWVANSAGFFYDPPAEIDDSRCVVRVQKNVAAMPAWFPLGYKDAVNSDPFSVDGRAVAAHKAKMMTLGISGYKTRSGISYRVLSMTIGLNEAGWDTYLLDAGYEEIDPTAPTRRRRIFDDNKNELTQPWPLNGSGFKLANPSPSNLVWDSYEGYQQAPFAALPLV